MTPEQFANTFTSLAMIYGKEYTKEQLTIYYSLLKDIDINQFKLACGNLAKSKKFMPTVADIREEVINNQKAKVERNFIEVIEKMKNDNYFKNENELDKVLMWKEKGIIPNWLKDDLKKYGYGIIESLDYSKQLLIN